MREIKCHNSMHLGDCIESVHFLMNASKHNDVRFSFACNPGYHWQIEEMIGDEEGVTLIAERTTDSVDLWCGANGWVDYLLVNCEKAESVSPTGPVMKTDQGSAFFLLSEVLSEKMEIDNPFSCKNDLVYNQDSLTPKGTDNKYDVLIVNSSSLSIGSWPTFEEENEYIIDHMISNGLSVITTRPHRDLPCTLNQGLGVVGIGRLASQVDRVVAVNTGPLHLCMNKWSLDRLKEFVIWFPEETFNYGNIFKSFTDIREYSL